LGEKEIKIEDREREVENMIGSLTVRQRKIEEWQRKKVK